ncbi:MAG: transcriptional repressor LexA [Candidatus Dojkabacteria bacterium]
MAPHITPAQEKTLEVIKHFLYTQGFAPSLSELQEALGGITKRGVVKHLEALEKKGRLQRSSKPRGIRLIEANDEAIMTTNILGYANAGSPMTFADQQRIGVLRIDKNLLPVNKNIFALVIKGDSMNTRKVNGTKLEDGNYAIVSNNEDVRNGDVVLAIIDNCATIKTYRKDGRMIVLYPESSNRVHKPIYLSSNNDGTIYGKVIATLRNPM